MERWMALTIALGALAENMRDIIREMEKEVSPVEIDFVYVSSAAANVKLKYGWEEFAEKMGPAFRCEDYGWARYLLTRYGDFYEEKKKEEDGETV